MIAFQETPYPDDQIYTQLNPLLRNWFKGKFKGFTEPQKFSIMNIHFRENTLICAPTGTGKTLSAFTAVLNELITLSEHNQLEDKIYAVYISPLKALSNDVEKNLNNPLKEIQAMAEKQGKAINVRVGVRTGDTTANDKSKMLRKPPHILITTPESIAIILNSPKFVEKLKGCQWVIVDEIHALAPNKRGVHLSLTLERLQAMVPGICRVGLSATIAPLEEIARYLVGKENETEDRNCKIVNAQALKKLDLKVLSPLPDLIHTTAKDMMHAQYELMDDLIQSHKTTLIFTNTRSATERVVHHLKDKYPGKYEGLIGAHHSSLSKEHRFKVENDLKDGKLKVCVSSTSLELGIDIGYIDLVILLGSPKSVARALQRVGRAGHQLHSTVKGRIIVLDRDDLVECAVLLKEALEKKIDTIHIPENCLDVLAQQMYGMAIEKIQNIEDAFWMIKKSYCYRNLSRSDYNDLLHYLAGDYTSLEIRHIYSKIWVDEENHSFGKRGKMARVIYLTNIGTIPDEAHVTVKVGENKIGYLDEGFVEKLKRGDVFVLGGQSYEFQYTRGMTVQVKAAYQRPPTVPNWVSEMLPLSFDLASRIQQFRGLMEEKFHLKRSKKEILEFIDKYLYVDKNSGNAIYEYFLEQFLFSEIPNPSKLLIEQFRQEEKNYFAFHTLYGRKANDALSRAYAFVLGRMLHQDIDILLNDNGFILVVDGPASIERAIGMVKEKELRKILEFSLKDSELLKRRFRHCATRGLMILRTYKGRTKSVGRQQMSSMLLLSAVRRISEDFSILKEAKREVLEDVMDIDHATQIIQMIEKGKIKPKLIQLSFPSPFAFNMVVQGRADTMKIEGKLEFIQRMHEKVLKAIEGKKKQKE